MAPHSLPHSSASAYFRHRMMSDTSTPSDRYCVSAGGIYTSLQGESKYIYHYHRTRYVPCDAHSAVYKDDIPRVQQSIKPPAEGAQQKTKWLIAFQVSNTFGFVFEPLDHDGQRLLVVQFRFEEGVAFNRLVQTRFKVLQRTQRGSVDKNF